MKKILLLVLLLISGFVLVACDQTSTTSTVASQTSSTLPGTTSSFSTSTISTSMSVTTSGLTTLNTTTLPTTITTLPPTTTTSTTTTSYQYAPIEVSSAVYEEARKSFKFFWEVVNGDPSSPGYGMIADRFNVDNLSVGNASIASVGYGLAAIPIGIENDWIGYQEGYLRVLGTLETLKNMQRVHGFYYHFVKMSDATRAGSSEVSVIDTAILISGAIMAGEYFGGIIKEMVDEIYQAIEWNWYFDPVRAMFYMGYDPDEGKFSGHWDHAAEQLMMYVLAAGSTNYYVGKGAYDIVKNRTQKGSYGTSELFYISWAGSLFTYQFSHAWIDFRGIRDAAGYDWFNNSVQASIAAYDYGQQLASIYKTFGPNAWGASASDGPDGYNGSYGNLPSMGGIRVDGTLAPYGAAASIVFTPEKSILAIEHYASIPALQSKYGFRDAYHLGMQPTAPLSAPRPSRLIPANGWFNSDVIGIDKGITLIMIENYRSSLVWDFFMKNEAVQAGLQVLGFTQL
jgi:hypothetical protein